MAQEGKDLYEVIAKLSNFESLEAICFNDNVKRKISCFFIDKAKLEPSLSFHYIYGKDITSLSFSQSVDKFGISGSVQISDKGGSLTTILEKQSNFYFVISIFEIYDEHIDFVNNNSIKTQNGFMLQPYIFEVESSNIITSEETSNKIYEINFIDIISATLKKISYGNLLLEYPSFINSNNFVELFQIIIDYATTIINLNHNKNYFVDNSIEFDTQSSTNLNEIIRELVLKDFPIYASCYELLNHIFKFAGKEEETPPNFNGVNVGKVIIPIILQYEILDLNGTYEKYFNNAISKKIVLDIQFANNKNITSGKLIKKLLICKSILKPFQLAFNNKDSFSYIYENINPKEKTNGGLEDSESIFSTLNGLAFSPLENVVDLASQNNLTGPIWKNLALLSETPSGSGNILVFFNWIYEYYKETFLNGKLSALYNFLKRDILPVVEPHFHLMEKNNLTGGSLETFSKMNANTIVVKSTNIVKEALFYVGKVLKSFIFMTSLFGFKIKGSIFRHPGEIIKINSCIKSPEDNFTSSILGGMEAQEIGFVLAYTTSITHIFNNSRYDNVIYASKVCSFL